MSETKLDFIAKTLEFLRQENAYVYCWKGDDPENGYHDTLLYGFMSNQWWVYSYAFQSEDVLDILLEPGSFPCIHIK